MKWTSKTLVLMIIGILIITVGSGDASSESRKSKSKLEKCPNYNNVNDTCTTAKGEKGLCMASGKSSGSSKKCKSKGGKKKCHLKCVVGGVCKAPPVLLNGCYSVKEGDTMFGAKATATCATNYKLTGKSFIHCLFEGAWSKPAASCEPIKCESQPQNVTGGHLYSVSNPALVGTTAILKCDGGCKTSCYPDNVTAICQLNGKWSKTNGKCASNTDCPEGWIYSKKSCFWIGNERMQFAKAESYCKNRSSHLATFKSEEEYLSGLEVVLKYGNNPFYWVGYFKSNSKSAYIDIIERKRNNFIRWGYRQPRRSKYPICVAWTKAMSWTMRNLPCNAILYPLCKKHIC